MEDIVVETDLQTQEILLAASNHDVRALRDLLRNSSANVQDPETGITPLHAAILACEPEEKPTTSNGDPAGAETLTNGEAAAVKPVVGNEELQKAVETVKILFQNGAIWNDLDSNGETPGCIAYRLGLKELYEMAVDAGVRAELLLNRLDEYQLLGDTADDEDEDEEPEDEEMEILGKAEEVPPQLEAETKVEPVEEQESIQLAPTSGIEPPHEVKSEEYLSSVLRYTDNTLLDSESNGVMMSWETDIMRRSAELLATTTGLRVLNVGFGMGIVDGFFQQKSPASHHIIEAHPDVIARIKQDGWHEKSGVIIHEGRWQDVLPKIVEQGDVMFDAIYFDTFAEDYKALREFFSEYAVQLLEPQGRFGFFNGLGADRQVCYDVYTKVRPFISKLNVKILLNQKQIVEMDLFEAGFDTEWENIAIPDLLSAGEWNGVRRRYWVPDTYRLPTCKLIE